MQVLVSWHPDCRCVGGSERARHFDSVQQTACSKQRATVASQRLPKLSTPCTQREAHLPASCILQMLAQNLRPRVSVQEVHLVPGLLGVRQDRVEQALHQQKKHISMHSAFPHITEPARNSNPVAKRIQPNLDRPHAT